MIGKTGQHIAGTPKGGAMPDDMNTADTADTAGRDDIHWWSATETARRIAAGEVSSREVLDHLVARTDRLDRDVNAVVWRDLEAAQRAADAADEAVRSGAPCGPFHGVPITVKDSFQTAGMRTTSGAPELADFTPDADADPVARLRVAGCVIWGKTNLPIYAGDIQSHNEVYGVTVNPWDPSRTCGGSSGGSAAALSLGLTALELGSDIGGSIRVPAHYCGVMGHKPSFGLVPAHGQIPGPPGTFSQADLAVSGPMARHIEDLETALDVLAGPDRWMNPAWSVALPPARHQDPSAFRVAMWPDDPACPVDTDTARVMTELATRLTSAGIDVDIDARPGVSFERMTDTFLQLLYAALSGGHAKDKIEHLAASPDPSPLGDVYRATGMRHRDWLSLHERRLQIRERWAEFFTSFDVMLMPVQPRDAIEHDHTEPQFGRSVTIDGATRPYMDLFRWVGPAGVAYLPSTVVPVGMSQAGLPIGVQVIAPYLEDRTALRFAAAIADLSGGCPRPESAQ